MTIWGPIHRTRDLMFPNGAPKAMNKNTCDHEYTKVSKYAHPEPEFWTCTKCSMVASDTTVVLMQIGRLSAKVDRVLELIGTPP